MGWISPRMSGIMWNVWSQGVLSLSAKRGRLWSMKLKGVFNFRNHGNRELRKVAA